MGSNLSRDRSPTILDFDPQIMATGVEVSSSSYGKHCVRLMRVRRQEDVYSVTELKLNVELELATHQDYHHGDNSDVVATDSVKNTVFVLARKNKVSPNAVKKTLDYNVLRPSYTCCCRLSPLNSSVCFCAATS